MKHRVAFVEACTEGSNVVVIDSDLSDAFPNSDTVNEALRDYFVNQERAAT